jgi:peptidoglycan/LPS O-acetylase OafA/YrhL
MTGNTRIHGLDGLRGILAVMIIAGHSYVPFMNWPGRVDVFFVISGFLITGILSRELAATGRIDYVRFIVRRARKLLPPLLAMCAIVYVIWPQYAAYAWAAVTMSTDYHQSLVGGASPFIHTWSLSVEEHFYLLWPIVLILCRRLTSRGKLAVMLTLYCVSGLWRNTSYEMFGFDATYYRFDPRLSGLLAGSIVALAGRDRRWIFAVTAVAAADAFFGLYAGVSYTTVLGTPCAIVATMMLIATLQDRDVGVLSNRLAAYVGRRSYGVYLFHFPIVCYMDTHYSWGAAFIAGCVGAIICAEVWARVEKTLVDASAR